MARLDVLGAHAERLVERSSLAPHALVGVVHQQEHGRVEVLVRLRAGEPGDGREGVDARGAHGSLRRKAPIQELPDVAGGERGRELEHDGGPVLAHARVGRHHRHEHAHDEGAGEVVALGGVLCDGAERAVLLLCADRGGGEGEAEEGEDVDEGGHGEGLLPEVRLQPPHAAAHERGRVGGQGRARGGAGDGVEGLGDLG
mmetsp:Transcript_45996/g.112015  ORF Transcript_45996/g.112015 Transcript_45996/m.112015 type:complete len:200 (-) Transcript_45996:230-829(-)